MFTFTNQNNPIVILEKFVEIQENNLYCTAMVESTVDKI